MKRAVAIVCLSSACTSTTTWVQKEELLQLERPDDTTVTSDMAKAAPWLEQSQWLQGPYVHGRQMPKAELMPGFFRVVLSGADLPHGTIFRGIWHKELGGRFEARGLDAFARWARAVSLCDLTLDAWKLGQAMETLGAFPAQFDSESVASAFDPETNEHGGVTQKPFVVTAIRVGYVIGGAPIPSAPDEPDGPPPDGPPGGGPPGGWAPPIVGRARLTAAPDYSFAWSIETRQHGPEWTPLP